LNPQFALSQQAFCSQAANGTLVQEAIKEKAELDKLKNAIIEVQVDAAMLDANQKTVGVQRNIFYGNQTV